MIKPAKNGGDKKEKRIVACLHLTNYRSLPMNAREKVRVSVRSGKIVVNPADDDENQL